MDDECDCKYPGRYAFCKCNSASEEPCNYCDWAWYHECPTTDGGE